VGCKRSRSIAFEFGIAADRTFYHPIAMMNAAKIIAIAGLVVMPFVAWHYIPGYGWETVSFQCKPQTGTVMCKLIGEPRPGKKRIVAIAKHQLSGVKVRTKDGPHSDNSTVDMIVLTTIDNKEIPLTIEWGGAATVQMLKQYDQLAAFIADPYAQTLSLKTDRELIQMAPALFICCALTWGALQTIFTRAD
jgi:hypothetical protein